MLTILRGEGESQNLHPDYDFIRKKVEFLCNNGADVNKASFKQARVPLTTPLQALYKHDSFNEDKMEQKKAIAEVLITSGANPKVIDSNENTLLHQCARSGDAIGLAYFIEHCQLDPNQLNVRGISPLEELCHWNTSSYSYKTYGKACIEVLSTHGVDPTIKRMHSFKIDVNSLNPNLPGVYLKDRTIDMIFEDKNNVFSQKAPYPLPKTPEEKRQLLTKIYNELEQRSVTVEIALYPEQLAFFSGEYNSELFPTHKAVEHIQNWRQEYEAQQHPRTIPGY
jgi:hypothetical protein